MYETYFSKRFDYQISKLVRGNPKLKEKIFKQIGLMISNPKHPSLRLHKLSGKENWSISVTKDIRILFSIQGNLLLINAIGTHDEVY